MRHRWLEHLLSLGIGLVALGMSVGLVIVLVGLFTGEAAQTTLPLAFDGAARHVVTLRESGAAVGQIASDHGTLTVKAGGAVYQLGQLLDVLLSGGLLLVILYRCRRLVVAIAGGRPFAAGNVRSLRWVGWTLIALNVWMWLRMLVLPLLLIPHLMLAGGWQLGPALSRGSPGEHLARIDAQLSIVPLLVGVVVLVLAEAFRAGRLLSEENEAFV